eukprot:COSAG04_NODE_435_length_14466_cov_135.545486_3_plen_206_part_00
MLVGLVSGAAAGQGCPSCATASIADPSSLPTLSQPALLSAGAAAATPPADALRRRWSWEHISEALSAARLGGPLTVQRDDAGLFPFVGAGALAGLLQPTRPSLPGTLRPSTAPASSSGCGTAASSRCTSAARSSSWHRGGSSPRRRSRSAASCWRSPGSPRCPRPRQRRDGVGSRRRRARALRSCRRTSGSPRPTPRRRCITTPR